jgi:hypothetical protein
MGSFRRFIWVTVRVYIYRRLLPDSAAYKQIIEEALKEKYSNHRFGPPFSIWIGLNGAPQQPTVCWICSKLPADMQGQTETWRCTIKWTRANEEDAMTWVAIDTGYVDGFVEGEVSTIITRLEE